MCLGVIQKLFRPIFDQIICLSLNFFGGEGRVGWAIIQNSFTKNFFGIFSRPAVIFFFFGGGEAKKPNLGFVQFSCQFKHFGITLIFFIFTELFFVLQSKNPINFRQFGTTFFSSFVTKFLISSIVLGVGRGQKIMNNFDFWTNHLLGRGVTNFEYHFSCSRFYGTSN